MYAVTQLPPVVKPSKATKADRYPFASLCNEGDGFIVPASDAAKFKEIRMLASKFGLKHAKTIRCNTAANGTLHVRLDKYQPRVKRNPPPIVNNVAENAPVSVGTTQVNDAPTREQFRTHVLTFAENQAQVVSSAYSAFFVDMRIWIDELRAESGKRYFAIDGPDQTLQIGLQPAIPTFFDPQLPTEHAIEENETLNADVD